MIETKRLHLRLLNAHQLHLWATNLPALELELSCVCQSDFLEGEFADIIKIQAEKVAGGADALFNSFWMIIRKEDASAIGSMAFKGPPNADNEVEIGYGLYEVYQGHGYATEAVQALCSWALQQNVAKNVIAETEPGNTKSEHVLQRCGFVKYKEDENANTWWKLHL
ncbi:MAG: GNAT family N-acetyltransferase [Defluviitaleaceae bacterium]|nr:GNAT family N-acetyltransferase [Defluviitaleaceae bacterium]